MQAVCVASNDTSVIHHVAIGLQRTRGTYILLLRLSDIRQRVRRIYVRTAVKASLFSELGLLKGSVGPRRIGVRLRSPLRL